MGLAQQPTAESSIEPTNLRGVVNWFVTAIRYLRNGYTIMAIMVAGINPLMITVFDRCKATLFKNYAMA